MAQDNKLQTTTSLTLYESNKKIMGSEYASTLTPAIAFEGSKNNLRALSKDKGVQFPILIITKLLKESLELIKHNLTVQQMAGYADMFVKNNPSLKIDEIILILTKGVNGEYGRHNGFFDYHVLNDWRSNYESNDRARYIESKNHTPAVGDSLRRSSNGESFGEIAKDAMDKINSGKSNFKESDALTDYKNKFKDK